MKAKQEELKEKLIEKFKKFSSEYSKKHRVLEQVSEYDYAGGSELFLNQTIVEAFLESIETKLQSQSQEAEQSNCICQIEYKERVDREIRLDECAKCGGKFKDIPQLSTQPPKDTLDLQRLYDWLMDENREPAQIKFTAGILRNIAKEIELKLFTHLKKEGLDAAPFLIKKGKLKGKSWRPADNLLLTPNELIELLNEFANQPQVKEGLTAEKLLIECYEAVKHTTKNRSLLDRLDNYLQKHTHRN